MRPEFIDPWTLVVFIPSTTKAADDGMTVPANAIISAILGENDVGPEKYRVLPLNDPMMDKAVELAHDWAGKNDIHLDIMDGNYRTRIANPKRDGLWKPEYKYMRVIRFNEPSMLMVADTDKTVQ